MLSGFLAWSLLLISQNISFTYVSRARNSGSLARHIKAAIFSNGIWIISNMVMLGPMLDQLTGKHGLLQQIITELVYTAATVSGGVIAHYWALRTEKGKNAVGANKKYAQIPVEEWARIKQLAEQAYGMVVDTIPSSGIQAAKVAGETVIAGVPGK